MPGDGCETDLAVKPSLALLPLRDPATGTPLPWSSQSSWHLGSSLFFFFFCCAVEVAGIFLAVLYTSQ